MKHRWIIVLFTILIGIILFCVGYSEVANDGINKRIKEFVSRGEYVCTVGSFEYYKVHPKYDYEDLTYPVLRSFDSPYLGTTGDLFVTDRNPMDNFFLTKYLSSRVWIGHMGIVSDETGQHTAEIIGNLDIKSNISQIFRNTWHVEEDTPRLLMLRVKNINQEQKEIIQEKIQETLGAKYNYTFIFRGPNTYYCSDYVDRILNAAGIELNKDKIFALGEDFIRSNDVYITYYKEEVVVNEKIIKKVYYLSEDDNICLN